MLNNEDPPPYRLVPPPDPPYGPVAAQAMRTIWIFIKVLKGLRAPKTVIYLLPRCLQVASVGKSPSINSARCVGSPLITWGHVLEYKCDSLSMKCLFI